MKFNTVYKMYHSSLVMFILIITFSCESTDDPVVMFSPDSNIKVELSIDDKGQLTYAVGFKGKEIVNKSRLGFVLQNEANLTDQFKFLKILESSIDTVWEQPWGEKQFIKDRCNQFDISMSSNGYALNMAFRIYDDGLGFRYEIPKQSGLDSVNILRELTEFKFTDDHQSWSVQAYQHDRYEYLYENKPISEIDVVHTPATLKTKDSIYISIHEAALTDFASMVLRNVGDNTLDAELVPWSDGIKVKGVAPMKSSWRTLQIAETPGELVTSNLILNLNEPNKLDDLSWIKPMKYNGIWWGMHVEKYSWSSGEKHGATTANVKEYIDFAADNGLGGVLVEGWNIGWDGDWANNLDAFRFSEPYPDFDIDEITAYAKSKNVKLIGHHETSAGVTNYENQIEEAFKFYQAKGVSHIKTGYVGGRLDGTEWHHGQFGVRHYRKVVELAAKYKIMIDAHEPIKDTGIRRTYPNMMTREGARGMEFDAWSSDGGNPPNHTTILPFTRLLAGPMDFTPGIFELDLKDRPNNQVNTTLAKQLAFYVVIYSPAHMAADLPENYAGQPAFQFIRDVPVDWSDTQVLNAEIGEYITVIRKDRNSEDWYLGSITNEKPRQFKFNLSFLEPGVPYLVEMYFDGSEANYQTNKMDIDISSMEVNSLSVLPIRLGAGGGAAVRFKKL